MNDLAARGVKNLVLDVRENEVASTRGTGSGTTKSISR
jgi:hypothetical protein